MVDDCGVAAVMRRLPDIDLKRSQIGEVLRVRFDFVDIILTILFTAGLVVLFWALHEESKSEAPFYITLSTIAVALTIAATFIAALRARSE